MKPVAANGPTGTFFFFFFWLTAVARKQVATSLSDPLPLVALLFVEITDQTSGNVSQRWPILREHVRLKIGRVNICQQRLCAQLIVALPLDVKRQIIDKNWLDNRSETQFWKSKRENDLRSNARLDSSRKPLSTWASRDSKFKN